MKTKPYKFLYTYKQSKNDFIKPKFHLFFGKWKYEYNLPIWRRGNIIRFTKNYGDYTEQWNYAKLINSQWTEQGKKHHPILSKLVKPSYMLPIWLSFYYFNNDITYKTKYTDDDFCYEFPSHITIVFFGLCFSITAYMPKQNKEDFTTNDDYWTSMLTYQFYNGDLETTNNTLGYYTDINNNGIKRFVFNPYFLKDKNKQIELTKLQNKILAENDSNAKNDY